MSCLVPSSASSSPSRTRRSASRRCSSVGSISPWSWPWWSWCSSCQSWWAICLASTSTSVGGSSKLDPLVERVHQPPLQDRPARLRVLVAEPLADLLLERVEALGPEALGELVVDLGRLRRLHRLHRHREARLLAGEVLGAVALREGHLHLELVAGLRADELVLEARDEALRAEHQREVLGRAALELDAVDRALEVDDHLVAVLGLRALLAVLVVLGRGREVRAAPRRPPPRRSRRRASRASARRAPPPAPSAAPRRSSRPRRPGPPASPRSPP